MAEYVYGKKSSVTSLADKIRAKTGATNLLSFKAMEDAIDGIGAKPNIHYSSTTAPTDTSQLWVKADINPSKVSVGSEKLTGTPTHTLTTLETTLPSTINDRPCVVVGNVCYLFNKNIVYLFNTLTNEITTLQLSTTVYTKQQSGLFGTKIYLFGGYSGGAKTEIYSFDTQTNEITKLDATFPTNASSCGYGVVGSNFYFFGGRNGAYSYNQIYLFDAETETLTTLETTLPTLLGNIACGVVGNVCYLFGGSSGSASDTIYSFDTQTNTITTLKTKLPSATLSMACGVVGNVCYLFGGDAYAGEKDTIYSFDTQTNEITTLETKLPSVRYNILCGVVGNVCYLFGGTAYIDEWLHCNDINIFKEDKILILPQNNIYLQTNLSTPQCKLINSDSLDISVGVEKCYLGNSENTAEVQTVAIHNGTEWQEI